MRPAKQSFADEDNRVFDAGEAFAGTLAGMKVPLRSAFALLVLLILPVVTFAQVSTGSTDFNGDGISDLLWRDTSTGETFAWLMGGLYKLYKLSLLADPAWSVSAVSDFNGDAKADLLWYNAGTGQTAVWLMNGLSPISFGLLLTDPNWKVTATADFNGDGKADLLWYNPATGQTVVWLMNGLSPTSFGVLLTDPNWRVSATADFNGDGKADLLWYNPATGQTVVWLMNGLSPISFGLLLSDPNWTVSATADFNGDSKADLLWYNAGTGQTAAWLMNGVSPVSFGLLFADPNWKVTSVADLDGDGKSDLIWNNTLNHQSAAWLMNGLTVKQYSLLSTSSTATAIASGIAPPRPGWNTFGGDLQHSGRNASIGPDSPALQWSFPASNPSAPAVANNGTIYLPSAITTSFGGALFHTTGAIYAIDSGGNQIWKTTLSYEPAKVSPSIGPDGTIYIRGLDIGPTGSTYVETMSAISPSGSVLWEFSKGFTGPPLKLGQHSPIVGPDGTIYVSFEDFNFYAINKDGSLKWSRRLSGAPYTATTIGLDGTIYINNFSNLTAMNSAGTQLWSVPLSSSGGQGWPSIGADGAIYLDVANSTLIAFNPATGPLVGSILWQTSLPGSASLATPSIGADGTIYQIAGTNLVALTSSGSLLWTVNQAVGNGGSITQSEPVIGADGTIYTRTDSRVFSFNPNGSQKWILDVSSSLSGNGSIVLSNGALYVNSNDTCSSCFSGLTKYK